MNNFKFTVFFLALFSVSSISYASEIQTTEKAQIEEDTASSDYEVFKHIGAHTVTSGLACFCMVSCFLKLLRAAVEKKDTQMALPFAGILSSLYLIYKTPQWTDTYILKNGEQRNARQNILRFAGTIINWPFGMLLTECSVLFDREKLKKEAKELKQKAVNEQANS